MANTPEPRLRDAALREVVGDIRERSHPGGALAAARGRRSPFHDRFKGTCNGSQDGAVRVHQAYRFALDPTSRQERALRSHAGASRFAWNWGLAKCQQRYAAEGRWYSAVDLHKLWNSEKKADPALSWWGENSKCTYQEAFRDLDRALRDFVKSRKGERKGPGLGFPRYKKRANVGTHSGWPVTGFAAAARPSP